MPKMTLTLFIPTLNEIEGMKVTMPKVPVDLFDQILVVDGNSTDGTADWSRSQGYDVHVQQQKGLRAAYSEGWPLITSSHVITFSPDGNCKPEDLPLIIEKLREGYDMVVASRYLPGAHSDDDDAMTGFGNWLFTTTINKLHGGHYSDAMTIYRGYRTKLFFELGLDKPEAYATEKLFFTKLGVEPLLSVRAAKRGLRVTEIPSDEPKRIHGERKLQVIRWGLGYMTQVFREKYYWR